MLTEKELLAMPKNQYMNTKQLEFFKTLLLRHRLDLTNAINDAKENLTESEHNTDPNDMASFQETQQLHLRTVDRQSKLLVKVNDSINKIERKEYGYCEVTGEPIGIERLLARPTANLSVQAKEIQEHKEKTQGAMNINNSK